MKVSGIVQNPDTRNDPEKALTAKIVLKRSKVRQKSTARKPIKRTPVVRSMQTHRSGGAKTYRVAALVSGTTTKSLVEPSAMGFTIVKKKRARRKSGPVS